MTNTAMSSANLEEVPLRQELEYRSQLSLPRQVDPELEIHLERSQAAVSRQLILAPPDNYEIREFARFDAASCNEYHQRFHLLG